MSSPLTPHVLTLANGLRLPCVEQGAGDGLPLLLLHGVTDSWRSFEPLLPRLSPALRAIAVTQRGHRGASQPAGGYDLDDLAGDALAVLDALGVETAWVLGHSMGASVARRLAAAHPARVRGLLLVGGFAALGDHPGVRELAAAVAQLRDPVDAAFVREFQAGTAARPLPPGLLDMVVGESLALPARVWQALFTGFLRDLPPTPCVSAPTLVIGGAHDTLCPPAEQQRLAAAIPGAEVRLVAGAGHAVHWDDPAAVAREVQRFVLRRAG